ncbi:MAG: hypothetical protein ACW99U_20980 [Candidatus Thorarchaeota archaeon]
MRTIITRLGNGLVFHFEEPDAELPVITLEDDDTGEVLIRIPFERWLLTTKVVEELFARRFLDGSELRAWYKHRTAKLEGEK